MTREAYKQEQGALRAEINALCAVIEHDEFRSMMSDAYGPCAPERDALYSDMASEAIDRLCEIEGRVPRPARGGYAWLSRGRWFAFTDLRDGEMSF